MAVVLVVVLVWPMALELGQPLLAVLAGAVMVVRFGIAVAGGRVGRPELGLVVISSVALVSTAAFAASWTAMVVGLCLVAGVIVARPQLPERWSPNDGVRRRSSPTPRLRRFAPHVLLGAFGLLIGVWHVGINWWSADNAYYLNKANHVSRNPTSFGVRDYMFGVDGAVHHPLGNILSSFEPMVGTASAVFGVSVPRLLFQLLVPAAMFFVPFAMRYAARGLGALRTDLVAAFAAASIVLMTGTVTVTLFAQASHGKTVGYLIGVPILMGAAGQLVRRGDARSALRAALATICLVGLSPSLAGAVLLVLVPFTGVAVWGCWTSQPCVGRQRIRDLAWLALPLVLLVGYSLYARGLQRSAGEVQTTDGFLVLPRPDLAWEAWFRPLLPESRLTDLFLVGGVAVFPLVLGDRRRRRAAGLMVLLVFGIVYAPWSFELVVQDVLGLDYFASRLFWSIPIALLIGLALGALDSRRRLGLLTVLAATLALGLSGPDLAGHPIGGVTRGTVDVRHAPQAWPWQAGIPAHYVAAARAIADATPPGGRFLGPPTVEEVTTALRVDVFPTYVREVYVLPIGQAKTVPPDFDLEDRLLLESGMRSGAPPTEPAAWRRALENLDIATVCTDTLTDPTLEQVIAEDYSSLGSAGACTEVWSRSPP
jgi:hypothetical protein